jgi:electron transfer flavoprotein beta subunit
VDEITETEVFLTVTSENGWMKEKVSLPCLISMDADINTPRLPSYRIKKNLKEDCVVFYGLNDLPDSSPEQYGLKGSATQVERIFPPEKNSERIHLEGDADSQAQQLCDLLRRKKLI